MTEQIDKITKYRLASSWISTVLSITLVLFMIGLLGVIIINAQRISEETRENISFEIMLLPDTKQGDILAFQKRLEAEPYVKSARFISKEEATQETINMLGHDFREIVGDILPPSILLKIHSQYTSIDSLEKIEKAIHLEPNVTDIQYQRTYVENINENIYKISLIMLIISAVFLIIAITLINNTIRLSIYSKRFLIKSMLEKKYPEFAHLMKEYHEGVLLYELSERKVWKKAEIDTIGLKAFYQNVKNDYLYPVRVKVNTYTFADETAYNQWDKLLKKGKSPLEAQEKINKKTALVLQKLMLRWKGQEASFDSIFNWNDWKEVIKTTQSGRNTEISLDYKSEQIRNLYMHKPTLTFVEVKEFLAPSPRPLEEVKGVIVSLYQNYLEEEWIKTLRAENEVWVDYDKILSLIKE
jgi:uncharacterized membrane protein